MNNVFVGFIVALILGIITLLIIKWRNFYKDLKSLKLPPWENNCPDYWLMEGDGKCRNIHRLGKCALEDDNIMNVLVYIQQDDGVINFSKKPFIGKDGEKNKCRIAKVCNMPWTGIDNKCI